MNDPKPTYHQPWLPTTKKEIERLGWDYIDVILFTGDAYIDHPSMGVPVIGRVLQSVGYRVAIVPQPNWQDDLRDFTKLGRPRLYFGVSAGAMDSMVNHYTAARRRRSDDAYTPEGRAGARPDYPTIVYTKALKKLFPDVPVVIGGIEASMRRLSHYDYWQDKLLPSILIDSGADMLMYGMGEKTHIELASRLSAGEKFADIKDLPQTAILLPINELPSPDTENIILHPYEDCLANKRMQAENFKTIEVESNRWESATLWQPTAGKVVKVNHSNPPLTSKELDSYYDLPYTRLPHPRYKGKRIPAYEMIRHSVTMHRGCFGGCAFCTISAHQGKHVSSRSEASIIKEVSQVAKMDDFKGYISDLGGPSANMYNLHGKDINMCKKCTRPSCLHPSICHNLNTNHTSLLSLYHKVDSLPGIKKTFIGSGVRYDLAMHSPEDDSKTTAANRRYIEELIARHVSGRLKVAPEHTSDTVLNIMRKPSFSLFKEFNKRFDEINNKNGMNQQLIPYFISSHPGCTESDMAELAATTKDMHFHLEQVQDFTPTPMTLSTETYYTGVHPYTMKPVFTAKTKEEKLAQRKYFFWYLPENRNEIIRSLKQIHREDLMYRLYPTKPYNPRKPFFNKKNKLSK